jgi:hypothetical protein
VNICDLAGPFKDERLSVKATLNLFLLTVLILFRMSMYCKASVKVCVLDLPSTFEFGLLQMLLSNRKEKTALECLMGYSKVEENCADYLNSLHLYYN